MGNIINEHLKDVSDKVKEVITQLNSIKEDLHKEYGIADERLIEIKNKEKANSKKIEHLKQPVKKRQKAKKTIY